MNPLDWFLWIYRVTGGEKKPLLSFGITMVVFAIFGAIVWRLGQMKFADEQKQAPTNPASVTQTSAGGDCSNVVAGKNANLNCTKEVNKSGETSPTNH